MRRTAFALGAGLLAATVAPNFVSADEITIRTASGSLKSIGSKRVWYEGAHRAFNTNDFVAYCFADGDVFMLVLRARLEFFALNGNARSYLVGGRTSYLGRPFTIADAPIGSEISDAITPMIREGLQACK